MLFSMRRQLCVALLAVVGLPVLWAARGTTSASSANAIFNSTFAVPASNGAFSVAFWFKSGNLNPSPAYLVEGGQACNQWAVIYGYTPGKIEFYVCGNSSSRQNSSITISDTGWHHIAYRKSAAGASSWDKFLDGVKTNINPSISFSLPSISDFFTFIADNHAAPCVCSLGDVVFYNAALTDAQIQALAAGNHPTVGPNMLLYWPLSGTSSPEPDASGNNHPGTVQGNVIQVPDPPYATGGTVSVSVSPSSIALSASQTQQFTATVTGSSNTAVNWSLSPAVGTVTTGGLYTAPSSINSAQTVTLTATSQADPSKSGTATISLTPVNVSVSPPSISLGASQTQQFTATVTGSGNTAVTWSLSPVVGTVTTGGFYTAPSSISSAQTVTLIATSQADSSKSGTATISLTPTSPPPPPPPTGNGSVARGATTLSPSNVIQNTSYAPLSNSTGPFTIAFWFQTGNVNSGPSYVLEGNGAGQWAVIYGYTSQQIEFFSGDPNIRVNTGIPIADSNWHHVAYRKSVSGTGSWDKFLDGVKTTINSSISFTLPSVASLYALNSDNSQGPCQCNIADLVVYDTARPDAEIQGLAAGIRPTLKPTPLLYWPLSGTSSNEPDGSGNNHPGTVLGSIQTVPGPPYGQLQSRTVLSSVSSGMIKNTSFGPLSGSNGPFTVAFWFQSTNLNPGPSYVMQAYNSGASQWAVIYGYAPQQIEFYTGTGTVRQNTGIQISDQNWHHIAYRKSAAGSSSWDKFVDGVKTTVNASINFSLPSASSFYAFNASVGGALCHCSLADIALFNSSLLDSEIQSLAQGAHPSALPESPVLYWPLYGAVPEPDLSGNNHNGTVVGGVTTTSPPPYTGDVTVTPASASVYPSGSQPFTASVVGGGSAVTWFLNPNIGTIDASGNYQAPSSISAPTTVTITATSDAFPTQYGTASVVVNPGPPPPTPGAVLTAQYDLSRTNSNPNETVLTNTNINVNSFGNLFSLPVDGYLYAQPLYVPSSLIPSLGHNTVFLATMHNTVYAFDADTGTQLWTFSLGIPQSSGQGFLGPENGILSTPVIDPVRQVMFVVGRNTDGFRIHAIDLSSHTERPGSPVLIQGTVSGPNGYDAVNGQVSFNAAHHLQRAGLLLANGTVYVAFASVADVDPYHGWIFGYNADTLAQSVLCVTPNGGQGGVWMSGGAPASDASGNIFFTIGNGSWDGVTNFGESIVKTSSTLSVLDWFTPANWSTLNANDADLGSTGAMLLPATSLLASAGKDGALFLLNQTTGQMGHLQGGAGNPPIVQTFQATTNYLDPGATKGLFNGMAYWSTAPGGGLLFLQASNDFLKSYRFTNGSFNQTPVAQTSVTRPYPGGALAVSSNGGAGGVVWAITPDSGTNQTTSTGVLRAFDALSLTELWNSNQNAARDALGLFPKFTPPTVVNGRVYAPTFSNKVVVYGLLP